MKAKRVLVCGLMVVILSLAFVTCDSGGGGGGGNPTPQTVTYSGTANGTAYTLKITENLSRAAYTPQAGDSYELTAGTNKSTGTVDSYSNGSFTLKPSNAETFTATVSGNNLTGLTGSSKWDNGTAFTAPGTLTPGGGGGGGGGNNLTAEEMAEIKEGLQTFYDFIVAFDGEAAWGEAINEINAEIPGLNLPKTNPSTWSNAVWNRLAEHADEFADVIDKILGEEGGGDFVAVTNITGVPATATAGTALTLTGTVEPSTATNKTIAWSVVSGSATVSGSTLNATAAGTVTVRATIANGTAQGTNYTKDFTITVSAVVADGSVKWWAGTWTQIEDENGGSPAASDNTLTLMLDAWQLSGNWSLNIARPGGGNRWNPSGTMWGVSENSSLLDGGGRALRITTSSVNRHFKFEIESGTKVKLTDIASDSGGEDSDWRLLLGVWEKQ